MIEQSRYFIGLMSGTSLDGIDAVLTDFNNATPKLLATHSHSIPENLRTQILETLHPDWTGSLKDIGSLHQKLGKLFSEAVNQLLEDSDYAAQQIQAIGSHGQTLWHEPQGTPPFTMQLGDANLITENTGITTIADFRSRDIAAGGQGAPLVPAFHKTMLSHPNRDRIILNIGGIANISVLPSIESKKESFGFDTGPGNGLLDAWITRQKQQEYIQFDKNGDWARSGSIIPEVLKKLLSEKYFSLSHPKSTGKEDFNLIWLQNQLGNTLNNHKAEDIQATLLELTATSISNHIKDCDLKNGNEVFVCGGGIHNNLLMERLKYHLTNFDIHSTKKIGIDPDWMEAIAFAWLAKQTLEGKSGNLPEATGAIGPRILGAIYQV